MSPLTEQKVDWDRCTCLKVYHGGEDGSLENVRRDVDPIPVVYRVDPACPELWKPDHPKIRGQKS